MTIEELKGNHPNWIVYEFIRGSRAYGLDTPESDTDFGGVFVCPQETLLGLRSDYVEQVSDERGDTVYYEFGRWIELLLKANPSALESLFIPERFVMKKPSPIVQKIIDSRELFLTKECFNTFRGYAVSQIGKARGLNKKITNPVEERRDVLSFCSVYYNDRILPLSSLLWLNGLKQQFCGLKKAHGVRDGYFLYYDWGGHAEKLYWSKHERFSNEFHEGLNRFDIGMEETMINRGYNGIVALELFHDGKCCDANDVRLSNIPEGVKPLTMMFFDKDAYSAHCRDYHDYQEWKKNRNPIRYESNLGQNYDGKNMMHCMRLIRMCKEIADGRGLIVNRSGIDREFLLSIKNHEMEYDKIMEIVEKEKKEMTIAMEMSHLPEKIDVPTVDKLLIEARKSFYCKN